MSGNAGGVCNSTESYSVAAVAGITYNWTTPAGANILSGQGTNAVSVQFTPNFVSGTLAVTATNACGTSAARTKAITAKPAVPGVISGATSVCKGQTGVNYSISPVYNATSYTWTAPNLATIAAGQGTVNAVVDYATNSATSKIRVKATNACGTSGNKTLDVVVSNCPKISDFTNNTVSGISLMPNPATSYVEVQYNSNSDKQAEIRLTNVLGQSIYVQSVHPDNGLNSYMIDLKSLTPGVYVVSILQDGKSFAQRLVIE